MLQSCVGNKTGSGERRNRDCTTRRGAYSRKDSQKKWNNNKHTHPLGDANSLAFAHTLSRSSISLSPCSKMIVLSEAERENHATLLRHTDKLTGLDDVHPCGELDLARALEMSSEGSDELACNHTD